jgi:MFS superfamily sulfate permease-like transporter
VAPQMQTLTKNTVASLIVFLVALPLCLGIAIASGVTPEKGIISGAIGGIVVGLISGSPLQVSGPANSLIVVVADAVNAIGLGGLAMAVILAGLAQVVAGSLGLGRLARMIPAPVTQAMLVGFALIIIASQMHIILDHKPVASFMGNLRSLPQALQQLDSTLRLGALPWGFIIGASSLVLMLFWRKVTLYAPTWFRKLPSALVVCAVATILATVFSLSLKRVHVPDSLLEDFSFPDANFLSFLADYRTVEIAITLFVLASAESMLSASAVDQMTRNQRTNFNRELVAQGVGNVLCGLLGALPVAGVIIRSTANVAAGATNRLSTMLHGVWLLAMATLLPFILDDVPMAVLGAILLAGSIRLLDVRPVIAAAKRDPLQWAVFGITLLGVLFIDALAGVGIGILTQVITAQPAIRLAVIRQVRALSKRRRQRAG